LSQQGVYAFGLFLASRKIRDPNNQNRKITQPEAIKIDQAICEILALAGLCDASISDDVSTEFYADIGTQRGNETPADALRRLLLTKQLMEIALNYGRYHAKAQNQAQEDADYV